jgi:hypothetical protein
MTGSVPGTPGGPGVKAMQPKCPLFPNGAAAQLDFRTILPGAGPRADALRVFSLAATEPVSHKSLAARFDSVRKRGPPSFPDQTNQKL